MKTKHQFTNTQLGKIGKIFFALTLSANTDITQKPHKKKLAFIPHNVIMELGKEDRANTYKKLNTSGYTSALSKRADLNGRRKVELMNNIYQLENGTLLTSEQLNGHLIKFMNVDNTPTYYYSDNISDLKSNSEKLRAKAHDNLQRIRLVPTDRETMSLLFDELNNKNDIVNTPNFYNYIAKVINSANNKMLRYRSEKLAYEHLNDIRQFFFIDIFEHTIERDDEKALIDFNDFDNMKELNRTLYKIATQELNKRLYKLNRDVSLDKEIQSTMDTIHANKFMTELEIALDKEHNDYKEYAQRLERYNEIIKSVATETQLENYYKVLAKKTYEQTTTFEERQAMSEEQKLATYKLTSTERSNYRHLVSKVQDRLK